MKHILITGKNSYIGTALKEYLMQNPSEYVVETMSVKDEMWKEKDFAMYDVVLHVAAVVHKREKHRMKESYFKINRDLPVEIALKAKKTGVSQFIFMSSMAVYGLEGKIGRDIAITQKTDVKPKSLYGISKMEAENELKKLNDDKFKVVIVRPPMVYGKNCPGNYDKLKKLAMFLPIFPMIENKRSMLHIDKLCKYLKVYIDNKVHGIFFPQDDDYVNTSLMFKELAVIEGKSVHLSKSLGLIIKLFGRHSIILNKVFGSLVYDKHIK